MKGEIKRELYTLSWILQQAERTQMESDKLYLKDFMGFNLYRRLNRMFLSINL
jgi:hypothetical protein